MAGAQSAGDSRLFSEGAEALRRVVGSPRQVLRADLYESIDGPARGSRIARLTSATGFDVEIFPDRGFDLGAVSWRGIPLAWLSAAGPQSAALVEPTTTGWNRSFGGGLLTTCGLDQFGIESVDGDETLPQHGRIHRASAEGVVVWSRAHGESWQAGAAGTVRQATGFAENLRMDRTVTTELGSDTLTVNSVVTNDGHVEWPHLVLFHLNLGWPIIAPDSRLSVSHSTDSSGGDSRGVTLAEADTVIPRDDAAAAGLADWDRFSPPAVGYAERVFRHVLPASARTTVSVESPRAGVRLDIGFATAELPELYQWTMLDAGAYVLGIEPANAPAILGRGAARAARTLPMLAPGESREYSLEFTVTPLD